MNGYSTVLYYIACMLCTVASSGYSLLTWASRKPKLYAGTYENKHFYPQSIIFLLPCIYRHTYIRICMYMYVHMYVRVSVAPWKFFREGKILRVCSTVAP